jgi:hypothetical protein
VSPEILPSTSSCANFLRCAWLLNGIVLPPVPRTANVMTSTTALRMLTSLLLRAADT